MGRLAVLPSEVKSLYLMLHQAVQMGLPTGPALLIPSNSQDSIPESVFYCLPRNSPMKLKITFIFLKKARSSGLAGPCLPCSPTEERTD